MKRPWATVLAASAVLVIGMARLRRRGTKVSFSLDLVVSPHQPEFPEQSLEQIDTLSGQIKYFNGPLDGEVVEFDINEPPVVHPNYQVIEHHLFDDGLGICLHAEEHHQEERAG